MKAIALKRAPIGGYYYEVEVEDKDVLKYGTILTDDDYMEAIVNQWGDGFDFVSARIRTIKYEGRIYYHREVNDEVIEFKELV